MIKESEIAAVLRRWLDDQGWITYPEVPVGWRSVVDIVAIKREPEIVWCIETKTSLSRKVFHQCQYHFMYADLVSVGVPTPQRPTDRIEKMKNHNENSLLRGESIGMIYIDPKTGKCEEVLKSRNDQWPVRSKFHGSRRQYLLALPDKMREYKAAGTPAGGVLTAFRETCDLIAVFVREHPGCTIKELVSGIDHHYSSDKGACSTICTRSDLISKKSRVLYKFENGRWRLYPEPENDSEKPVIMS